MEQTTNPHCSHCSNKKKRVPVTFHVYAKSVAPSPRWAGKNELLVDQQGILFCTYVGACLVFCTSLSICIVSSPLVLKICSETAKGRPVLTFWNPRTSWAVFTFKMVQKHDYNRLWLMSNPRNEKFELVICARVRFLLFPLGQLSIS